MSIGKMNKRITFSRVEKVKDEEGNMVETPTLIEVKKVWAEYLRVGIRDQERFKAGATIVQNTLKFRIRAWKGIKHDMRIIYRGRLLEIFDIDDTDDAYYYILCSEVGANG